MSLLDKDFKSTVFFLFELTPCCVGESIYRSGVEEGESWSGGHCGYKADKGLQNGLCTHPNPGRGRRAAGAREDGLGKDSGGD